jgi:hypothetical protein
MTIPLYERDGVDFSAYGGKKTEARQCLNHCVWDLVRNTRSIYKQPPGLKNPIKTAPLVKAGL